MTIISRKEVTVILSGSVTDLTGLTTLNTNVWCYLTSFYWNIMIYALCWPDNFPPDLRFVFLPLRFHCCCGDLFTIIFTILQS